MKVSILMLTLDHSELTISTFKKNIYTITTDLQTIPGAELEVLVADNGSKESAVKDYFKAWKPAYYRQNSVNEGIGKAFNQLYLRSTGDYIALLGNDIELPKGWVLSCLKYAQEVPNSGLVGVDWQHGSLPPLTTKFGVSAHHLNEKLNRVFGVWFVRRAVIEDVGLFNEEFPGPYGMEDSEANERVTRSGYNSFYIPTLKSKHLRNDVGSGTEYRKVKDESLGVNAPVFWRLYEQYQKGGSTRCPLPPMRDPL